MKMNGLLAAMLLSIVGCTEHDGSPEVPGPEYVTVETIRLGEAVGTEAYAAIGSVRASKRAELATRMMARIERIDVRAGDRVQKGQVLVTLERGAVAAARRQSAAGFDLASANLRRMERLYADSAIPLVQLEAARTSFEQAKGQAEAATAELAYTSIAAPFDGVISARYADPGDLAAPGQPVVVIEDAGAREIVIGVPEHMARELRPGRELVASVGSDAAQTLARVSAVVPSTDALSRTVEVRLMTDARLTPGEAVTVRVPLVRSDALLLSVPRSAIVTRGELTGVYLVGTDSIARLRWIRIGRGSSDSLQVISGLVSGDVVVLQAASLRDGLKVRPAIEQGNES